MLADRGLDAAISSVASACSVPVSVHVSLPDRLPAAAEVAAYFVVAEAIANVGKHSNASHAEIRIDRPGDLLVVEVEDNGDGGADRANGTGLRGLADRVAALDGRVLVFEPDRRPHDRARGDPMRVVIAEDLALLREGLVRLLEEAGLEVVAAVADGSDLLRAVVTERPDVAVVDVRLPPTFRDEGLRAALEARRRIPGLPVLVLSQYVEHTYAAELLADGAGGVGYLLKERVGEVRDFIDAVRRVAEGGMAMDPEVVRQLVVRRSGPLDELTPRELEVLALMAEGRSNAAIAARLVITESAVEKHVRRIFAKLLLPPSDENHRRVLAVLAFLSSQQGGN